MEMLLLDVAVKSTVVLAGAFGVMRGMRRSSATARHGVWVLAFAALMMLPVLTAVLPAWRVVPSWPVQRNAVVAEGATAEASLAQSPPLQTERADVRASTESVSPGASAHVITMPAVAASPSSSAFSFPSVLSIYALGSAIFLLPLLVGMLALVRLERKSVRLNQLPWSALLASLSARLGVRRSVALLESPASMTMPMTWGLGRSRILLPVAARNWSADRRRVVLLHELAHAKRYDAATQLFARLVCAMYWFQPLAWLALRQLRIEAESACDDLVLAADTKPSVYAAELLEIVTVHRGLSFLSPAVAMARGNRPQIHARIRAILDHARNRRVLNPRAALLFTFAVFLFILPLCALSAGDVPQGATTADAPSISTNERPTLFEFTFDDSPAAATTQPAAKGIEFSFSPLVLYPAATKYVHELGGSVAVTFVHNADVTRSDIGAVATLMDGSTQGNWENHSHPAPRGERPLLLVDHGLSHLIETEITFRKLPVSKVQSIRIILNSPQKSEPSSVVLLDPALGRATPAGGSSGILYDAARSTYETSEGLVIHFTGSSDSRTESQKMVECLAVSATARNAAGAILLGADRLYYGIPAIPSGISTMTSLQKTGASVLVLVSPTGISFEGEPTTWEALPALLEKVPDRPETILAFALTSDQMTVAQYHEAFAHVAELGRKFQFRYVSDAGIKAAEGAPAGTRPAAGPPFDPSGKQVIVAHNGRVEVQFQEGKVVLEADKIIQDGNNFSTENGVMITKPGAKFATVPTTPDSARMSNALVMRENETGDADIVKILPQTTASLDLITQKFAPVYAAGSGAMIPEEVRHQLVRAVYHAMSFPLTLDGSYLLYGERAAQLFWWGKALPDDYVTPQHIIDETRKHTVQVARYEFADVPFRAYKESFAKAFPNLAANATLPAGMKKGGSDEVIIVCVYWAQEMAEEEGKDNLGGKYQTVKSYFVLSPDGRVFCNVESQSTPAEDPLTELPAFLRGVNE